MSDLALLIFIIVAALVYDFFNGLNDCANAIATTVSTRALSPAKAIFMAALFNFIGALITTKVAATIGKGVINPDSITLVMVLAGLIGASVWTAFCSFSGIPISVTHSLVGGLVGAGLIAGGLNIINSKVIAKIILAMIISPLAGFLGGLLLIVIISWLFRHQAGYRVNSFFKRGQVASAAFMALSHGMNDAQNAMGVITIALVSYGVLPEFKVPILVIGACALAMGLGTAVGGWRVIRTLGRRVIKLKPVHGFSAETSGAAVITFMSHLGIPISTTHCISTAIMGAGFSQRISAVKWGVVIEIVMAWIITIPCTALIGALSYLFLGVVF